MHGIYKASFKEQVGRKRRILRAHYITSPKLLSQKPGGNAKWYNQIVSSAPQPLMNTWQQPVKRSEPVVVGPMPTSILAPIQKRRRQNNIMTMIRLRIAKIPMQHWMRTKHQPKSRAEKQANLPKPRAQAILNQSWWDTGDAIQDFGVREGEVSAGWIGPFCSIIGGVKYLRNHFSIGGFILF